MRTMLNGHEIEYVVNGHGPAVITLHGGPGFDHRYLASGLAPLASRAEWIHFDLFGHGTSSRPERFEGGMNLWTDDIDPLRAHVGHERIVLFGHSYGGFLALNWALAHPDRVAALVLCNTGPALDYPDVIMANLQARATPVQLAAFGGVLANGIGSDSEYAATWPGIVPLYFHRWRPDFASVLEPARYCAAAFNFGMACLSSFNASPRLQEIRVPTLILSGADDFITPVAQGGARLHKGIAGSDMVVFEQSGHYPFLEEPERFENVVGSWLDRVAQF